MAVWKEGRGKGVEQAERSDEGGVQGGERFRGVRLGEEEVMAIG